MNIVSKIKIGSSTRSFLIFISLGMLFSFSFYTSHSLKGALHTDEPGKVIESTIVGRNIIKIYEKNAFSAQPPLEYIAREKFFNPLGILSGLAKRYPDLFYRGISLFWWFLPVLYFSIRFDKFSLKNRFIISLSFVLLASSEFLGFYISEARHYSSIAAFFTLAILVLLDKQPFNKNLLLNKKRHLFLSVLSVIPLLHIVSFPFYLFTLSLFFFYIFKKTKKGKRKANTRLLVVMVIYNFLVVLMYLDIKRISSVWQHPAKTIPELSSVNFYIKQTLDWFFYKTPVYPIFRALPAFAKNNLVPLFGITLVLLIPYAIKTLSANKDKFPFALLLVSNVFLVWPLTVILFKYQAGMFTGERYSVIVLPNIIFLISYCLYTILFRLSKNRLFLFAPIVFSLIFSSGWLIQPNVWSVRSAEDIFVRENRDIISNPDNYIIADNGSYSSSLGIYAILNQTPLKATVLHCRYQHLIENGKNIINKLLKEIGEKNIYIFGPKREFMQEEKILWVGKGRVLYLLEESIPDKHLCNDPSNVKSCPFSCFKGISVDKTKRKVPGLAPHLDISSTRN